jgi:hypothetical protein
VAQFPSFSTQYVDSGRPRRKDGSMVYIGTRTIWFCASEHQHAARAPVASVPIK